MRGIRCGEEPEGRGIYRSENGREGIGDRWEGERGEPYRHGSGWQNEIAES